jgi:UDP-N-acetylmuramoyl-tripeptide--D-alanyl-D-alanine ligase
MGSGQTISWTTADILEATGGDLIEGDPQRSFSGVAIDSREISMDDLFVAIKGDVHDGHSFVGDVIKSGVRGVVVHRDKIDFFSQAEREGKSIVCVAVDDTTKALGDLAAFNRKRSSVSVVAITGSNGKTTTRAMTEAVVARRFRTLATVGNLNNEIGLPLTLLTLDNTHEKAVLELGMNRPGEIGRLAEICVPEIGVITNIGPAHLEGLGSIEGVMHAKGELLEKIKPGGTAVLNIDDPRVHQLSGKTSRDVLSYGLSENAKIRAIKIREEGSGISFELILPTERVVVGLKTFGTFMVTNALAAASVGHLMGLSAREIKAGLESFEPVRGRLNIFKTGNGIHVIDDTYNANPGSMGAAISTLTSLKAGERGIFVAGDMLELGSHSERLHRNIGSLAAESDIERLYITGEFAGSVAEGARDEDMDPQKIFIGTKKEILADLSAWTRPGDWILSKGSRGMAMESIVEGLKEWAD